MFGFFLILSIFLGFRFFSVYFGFSFGFSFGFYFVWFLHLSGLGLHRLGEVRAHEALEVEVGENVILAELEEGGKLGVGVDLAAIALVLELVGADVSVDLAGHGRASHLGTLLLAKEGGKLVTDAGGLDEARGLTVARLPLALGALLLGSLELALPLLLHRLVLALKRGDEGAELLELGVELGGLLKKRRLKGVSLSDGGGGLNCGRINNGSGGSSLGGLGSLRGLGHLGNINNGSGLSRGLSGLLILCHIILYLGEYLLSDLRPYIYYPGDMCDWFSS